MPREKVILACTQCQERNYFTTKNRRKHPERVEWKKHCPLCKAHTPHKELKKVTWPDYPQLKNATLVIIVFVAIVALIIMAMDASVRGILDVIMGIFAR